MARIMKFEELLSITNKNILGVNPFVEDFAFFDLWSKPVGLLYLLERLRGNGNCVSLIDCVREGAIGQKTFGREKILSTEIEKPAVYRGIKRHYHRFGMTEDSFAARLHEVERPDLVCITSVMTYWYGGVRRAIEIIRRELPNVPIALGGIYARLCPEHAAELGADFLVTENWTPDVPHLAMDLYEKISYGVTMTSFGCPLHCSYCASRVLWPQYSRRPLTDVLDEIELQIRHGARDIAFYDDALLLDRENRFYPLCAELFQRYGNMVRFHTPNGLHVRQIDKRCAAILKETNFKTIRLSLESIDPSLADVSSGKVAQEEYATAVKTLRSAGYERNDCETYILVGLPGQSVESVRETIEFVRECGGRARLAEFSPIPGTPSFKEAAQKLPELRTEPLLQNNSVYSQWLAKELSPEVMQELKDLARR